jgi:preprotein translocase subunit SecA
MIGKSKLPIPGLLFGMYPEQKLSVKKSTFTFSGLGLLIERLTDLKKGKAIRLVEKVRVLEKRIAPLNTAALNADLQTLQIALRKDGFIDSHIAQAFALINQVYFNTINVSLFDTQLTAAYYLLNNRLTEMATGEGKTFAVGLAAATAAISGIPVHVITANDYLASRDASLLQSFYQALGLTVDTATHGQDTVRRKQAYASDITYCTAKELVFDYLRDSLHRQKTPTIWHNESTNNTAPLVLRGLCMAIVDEADSILIDEASVPFILSQTTQNKQEDDYYTQSLDLAKKLTITLDFTLNHEHMQAVLTPSGQEQLEIAAATLPAAWHNRLHREEVICLALAALYLYHRDQHYLVNQNTVSIIDTTTGRVAEGRTWARGLHQLIEVKEVCHISANLSTIAQISYQCFFPRYLRLSGISGTLLEARNELFSTYGLHVSKVPLRLNCHRKTLPTRLFRNKLELRDALVEHIITLQSKKQPVLIGTESVVESELLAIALKQANIQHKLLNAKNDKNEAELVAEAGQAGAVTITTNMAGRGTDIKLGNDINALGGLHVINCQVNASRRVDRQLIGRAARQGDNGSTEAWLSLNNSLLLQKLPMWARALSKNHLSRIPSCMIKVIILIVQLSEEKHQTLLRKRLLAMDASLEENLSFSGVRYE